MRRSPYIAATSAVLVLALLVGCSKDEPSNPPISDQPLASTSSLPQDSSPAQTNVPTSAAPEDHAADIKALAEVTLTGNLGTMPFFTFTPPLNLTGEVARVADKGTGRTVEAGQAVAVHVASCSGQTATIEGSSYEEGQGPELLLADEANMPPTLLEAMVGTKVGSRVLFGAPVDGVTTLYSFEILATAPVFDQAEGTSVAPKAGLPVITLTDDGQPAMQPAQGDPSSDLVVQPLIKGQGDTLTGESWMVVKFSSWLWNGTKVVSTWDDGHPTVMRVSDGVKGWQQGLVGQTIGSQVLLVVPPDRAFGDAGTEQVPPNSTIVFVVDILGGM